MAGLFDPIDIKGLKLKNRIVMAPMETRMATADGEVTERHIRHYTARARGGAGLIIVEHTFVMPNGRLSPAQLSLCDDTLVAGLRQLVDAVHQQGAKIAIQLTHAGAAARRETIGEQPVGPSNVPLRSGGQPPRALTIPEIETLVEAFGEAARRAVIAGFDAVELHGAHGFLLCQFLSPLTNRRDDVYGGNPEGRARLPLEAIRKVKTKLPEDVPLFYRFGADDLTEGGLTPEEGKLIAPLLVQAGVDVIDVSGGLGGSGQGRFNEPGFFVPLAEGIKKCVAVPVIGVGNIADPEYADAVVRAGKVDLVAIGRALLSNPDFPRLAAAKLGVEVAG